MNKEGALWGKIILREAFKNMLPEEVLWRPEEVLWRPKEDLEFGSGMVNLKPEIEKRISDSEFQRKSSMYSIKVWGGKSQLYLYEIYRKLVGEIPKPKKGQKACIACGGGVMKQRSHCGICGFYPM